MSTEAPDLEIEVHNQLVARALPHFGESALSRFVSADAYDPARSTHNFDNVYFPANPKPYTPALFRGLASALSGRMPSAVTEGLVAPFEENIDELTRSAEDRKLMLVTGHQTMFEIPYPLYGLQRAMAAHTGRSYAEMARSSNLIVARALAVIDLFGNIPGVRSVPLVSIAQQLADTYLSFPATDNYRGDGSLPVAFQQESNARMLDGFKANTSGPGTLAVMAASGTTEKKRPGDDFYTIPRIGGDENHGTMSILLDGWDIVPVGGLFKHGLQAAPAEIIPAEEVSPDVVHEFMADVIAASREKHGGTRTVYET